MVTARWAGGEAGAGRRPGMTCGFCGEAFVEDAGQAACQACPLGRTCGYVRCPHCGYENPRSPAWLDRLRDWAGQ